MYFEEQEIFAAALIGFDMIEGPEIKWFNTFRKLPVDIEMENFLMNFYLSFRGGDDALQPLAILYKEFYLVAFPRGLELCCLFMEPDNLQLKLDRLNTIASEIMYQMDLQDEDSEVAQEYANDTENYYGEIKRLVINLLHGQEVSTPEIRRYFKLSNSEIWKVMSQLEENNAVHRTQKVGRTQYWTAKI